MKGLEPEIASNKQESLFKSLIWSFKRVAIVSAFACIALLSFNTLSNDSENSNQSFIERAFGIPEVSVDAAQEDFGYLVP